jgi:F1F0 ATPase subunit 2
MDASTMIGIGHSAHQATLAAVGAGGWFAAGLAIGSLHFAALRWNVRLVTGGGSMLTAFAVQLGRLAIIACMLAIVVKSFGALAMLAATGGILMARSLVIRWGTAP